MTAPKWDGISPATGTVLISCGGCGEPVETPRGPEHWHPAIQGVATSKQGVICPGCLFVTEHVTLDGIISIPEDPPS